MSAVWSLGYQGGDGEGDAQLHSYAIELFEHDLRPTAILQDLRHCEGVPVPDLQQMTVYGNKAFRVLLETNLGIWADATLRRVLDIKCPGEVLLGGLGVRLRVVQLRGAGNVRGVIGLNYPEGDIASLEMIDYPVDFPVDFPKVVEGEPECMCAESESRTPVKASMTSLFAPEDAQGEMSEAEMSWVEGSEAEESDDDDNPFPCSWVPKQFPHQLVSRNLPPPPSQPATRQRRLFSVTSSSTDVSATSSRKSAKQVGSIDPSTAIPPTNMVKHLPASTLPNWQAAADYFQRIGRGGRWIEGSGEGEESETNLMKRAENRPLMDWTQPDFEPLPQYSVKHYESLRAIDWSKTSLGPPDTWSACLLSMAITIMTNAYPTVIYWGSDYTIFYNEHFVAIAQNRNPWILGKTFAAGWPELASYFIPILDKAYYRGEATVKHEELLLIVGRVSGVEEEEETYFNFIICPVVGESGLSVGVMEQAFEVTREVISNRRMGFLRHLGETLARVDFNVDGEFMRKVLQAFQTTVDVGVWNDTPYMSLYGLDYPGTGTCTLVGSIGLPEGMVPKTSNLFSSTQEDTPHNIFASAMKEAMETGETVLMQLSEEDIQGIESRGKGKLGRSAIVIPIQAAKGGLMRGFLALGVNPRRPFDDDYRFWVGLLKTELSSTSGREELLKAEIQKAIDAEIQKTERARIIEVQRMLETRTKELRDSELLFTKTAETIPVGLALVDLNGDLIFTNSAYHELTTLPREENNPKGLSWRDIVYPEDRERVYQVFDEAVSRASSAHWESRTGIDTPERGWKYWVSCNMVVQTNGQTGELTGYMLTLADITQVKLAEEYQRQLSAQAVEKRRQQEDFIDIFSHELRNPFSATLQCADGILSGVTEYQLKGGYLDIDDIADAASTILVCVQHQMRIINDVLTLSKLDSMLLSVVPVDVQIHDSIMTTLKIFQSELQVKGIRATFVIGDSYRRLNLDWVKCDPARFNQILVNLLTNAIKFTSLQSARREIKVTLDACPDTPMRNENVVYTCSKPDDDRGNDRGESGRSDVGDDDSVIQGDEWGTGEPVYLHVKVEDTGIGISEHWQKKLFNRFEQVPKTHVTYGGSGLGLFICRKLCRLQGGRIGVFSEEGKGSKFAFYIKARRTAPPADAPKTRWPKKVQVISDNNTNGSTSRGGDENRYTPALSPPPPPPTPPPPPQHSNGVYGAAAGIPEHIIATFIPEHITTPRIAALRRVQSAMASQPSAAPQSSPAPQSPLKSSKPPPHDPQPPPTYRVLIVEDNLINQEVLRRQLRKENITAHVANNGQEGLDFLLRSTFAANHDHPADVEVDVVLMDMEMPIIDGNTATRMVRRLEREGGFTRHVPILGISANARSEQVAEMLSAGMDDAISKPFRIVELVGRMERLVGRFGRGKGGGEGEGEGEGQVQVPPGTAGQEAGGGSASASDEEQMQPQPQPQPQSQPQPQPQPQTQMRMCAGVVVAAPSPRPRPRPGPGAGAGERSRSSLDVYS